MKNNALTFLYGLLLITFFLSGCSKNNTNYYEDPENPSIGIFSNSGNNLQSCFIDGKAWRTIDRFSTTYGSSTAYEVNLLKFNPGNFNLPDTLQIVWEGYYSNNHSSSGEIILHLAVPANFTYTDFAGFNGQRIKIDSAVNGFFTTSANGINNNQIKANGNIYFNTANADSLLSGKNGKMSGLFDADFNSFKITNGRFDHLLIADQVNF